MRDDLGGVLWWTSLIHLLSFIIFFPFCDLPSRAIFCCRYVTSNLLLFLQYSLYLSQLHVSHISWRVPKSCIFQELNCTGIHVRTVHTSIFRLQVGTHWLVLLDNVFHTLGNKMKLNQNSRNEWKTKPNIVSSQLICHPIRPFLHLHEVNIVCCQVFTLKTILMRLKKVAPDHKLYKTWT